MKREKGGEDAGEGKEMGSGSGEQPYLERLVPSRKHLPNRTHCLPTRARQRQAVRCFHYRLATAVVPGCSQSPSFLTAVSQSDVAHAVAQCDSTAGDVLMRNVSLAVWARLLAHHECRPSCSRAEMEGAEARIRVLLRSWAAG